MVLLFQLRSLTFQPIGLEARSPLKLYVFDCGRLQFDSLELFGISNQETDIRELAVPCYVVEMHFDHAGVANELEEATFLIQRPEYESAFADSATAVSFGFSPWLWTRLRDSKIVVLEGRHDVFGDGRVQILPAPGHTPGHQVLFVDLADTGPLVLSGDLYHFRLSREDRRVPTVNFDRKESLESMERIEEFVDEVGAELWIEHELARFDTLRKAPSYYQ